MATKTLGTNGNNTLTAISAAAGRTTAASDLIEGNFANISAADLATIQEAILNDKVNGNPIYPGGLVREGLLYVPNRGVLKVLPGDWIGVDATGWPILVSANAIASGSTSWTHS